MDYYFDESGNWQGDRKEYNCLLIGGLLFKNPDLEKRLDQELRIFMADQKLKQIHTTDLALPQRELCYDILNQHLTNETRALVGCFSPDILNSKTLMQADEVYLQQAARLVQIMGLGDSNIRIHYDLKFHYAYPARVITNLEKIPYYMKQVRDRFIMEPHIVKKERDKLLKRLQSTKYKDASDRKSVGDFSAGLDKKVQSDPFDEEIERKLATAQREVSDSLARYFWSELWQKYQGQEKMREKFRSHILANINQAQDILGMENLPPSLKMEFLGKQKNCAGVVAIDMICNLVYREMGKQTRDTKPLTASEIQILDKIQMENCTA